MWIMYDIVYMICNAPVGFGEWFRQTVTHITFPDPLVAMDLVRL